MAGLLIEISTGPSRETIPRSYKPLPLFGSERHTMGTGTGTVHFIKPTLH